MGTSETDKAKEREPKTPAVGHEQSSATSMPSINPDWSGFQAYSPIPPHGFMASSPQAHPYMWGVQHIVPAYGAPPHPYVAMYPPGVYAHPVAPPPGSYPFSPFTVPSLNGVGDACGNIPASVEGEGGKSEKLPIKRSRGSLGSLNILTCKNNEPLKSKGSSPNGEYSKSEDSRSMGSSDGSDDGDSHSDSQLKTGERNEGAGGGGGADASQNGGGSGMAPHHSSCLAMVPTGPTTNLNIGMDYWAAPPTSVKVPPSRDHHPPVPSQQIWLQDEREIKRQRRKQSNRESARRSRLRKQAECDELAQRADSLKEENVTLRAEVSRIRSEYEHLLAENASLKERLGEGAPADKAGRFAEELQTSDQTEDA